MILNTNLVLKLPKITSIILNNLYASTKMGQLICYSEKSKQTKNAADLLLLNKHYGASVTRYYYSALQLAMKVIDRIEGTNDFHSKRKLPHGEIWVYYDNKVLSLNKNNPTRLAGTFQQLCSFRRKEDYTREKIDENTAKACKNYSEKIRKHLTEYLKSGENK